MDERSDQLAPARAEEQSRREPRGRLVERHPSATHQYRFDFDALAQDLASGLSRREALRRLGLGLGSALLAALGLAPAAQAVTCTAPEIDCFGVCVNPQNNPKHCGRCNAACNVGHLCCNGVCKNPSNDPRNCGACGIACAAGQFCCSGACINPKTDPNHCGSCLEVCRPGQSCINGFCVCPPGQVLCSGRCTDRQTDENNCGGCGIRCPATQVCQSGQCRPCPGNTTLCSGSKGRACCGLTNPTCCDGICCASGQFCCNNVCSICPCDKTLCTGSKGTNCCEPGQGCDDGVCCTPAGSGGNCSSGAPCCPGSFCESGSCVKPSGSTCQSFQECQVQFCTNNVCCIPAGFAVNCDGNTDCCAGSSCINDRCVKPSGSTCQGFQECQLGFCTNNVCCIPAGFSVNCGSNTDCCAGSSCINNRCVKPSGSTCQNFQECQLGFCTNNVCCIPAGFAVNCGSNTDCCAGSSCINNRCVKPSGSTCQTFQECQRGFCTNNVCCIPAGLMVDCSGDTDCCAGSTCVNNRCVT